MTLSFSTAWPKSMDDLAGEPNNFVNKIWAGLIQRKEAPAYGEVLYEWGIEPSNVIGLPPKLHTIREDKHNRWKPGVKIHPVINNRTKDRFQFAPTLVCTGVQEIHIQHYPGQILTYVDRQLFGDVFHHGLDDIYEYTNDLETLAINDGFPSVEAFFRWFNKDFGGKIIHWTDLKY